MVEQILNLLQEEICPPKELWFLIFLADEGHKCEVRIRTGVRLSRKFFKGACFVLPSPPFLYLPCLECRHDGWKSNNHPGS